MPTLIGTGYSAVAAGFQHNLALKSDGSLWAWGANSSGQLGDGSTTDSPVPKQIGTGFSTVTAGRGYTVALKGEGSVWAMGANGFRQLGDGTLALARAYRRTAGPESLVVNESVNGPLDLIPTATKAIPADKLPPFWLQVSKASSVSTAITYNTLDLGLSGDVYVVAYLDPASPLLAGSTPLAKGMRALSVITKGGSTLVAAVLTRSGWKQSAAGVTTESAYSGTLNSSNSSISMFTAAQFDQTKDTGIFCVGYAVTASTSSAKGLIRSVVTGADTSVKDCPPIQVGSTTDGQAPTHPTNLAATAAGPGQVNLSWTASTDNVGVAHYNVYRGGTLIATLGNVTNYSDLSSQASTAYSYSVMACDAALNCSGQSTAAQDSTPAQPSMALAAGWNLVGNGGSTAMSVASLFGDTSKVNTLWKWVRTGSTPGIVYPAWAFYTPSADGGSAYAASKGYDTLTTIQSGEGFWVNAKMPFSVTMTAPAWMTSSSFQPGQSKALGSNWSLIATGETQAAGGFNKALSATPPAAGTVPINLTTLWAWDNTAGAWYFYAPDLDASGGLATYIATKGYLDFAAHGKTLGNGVGFWVNRP